MGLIAFIAALVLLAAGCGGSGQATLVVGAVDDAARSDPDELLDELTEAGLGAVAVTSIWEPGLAAPTAAESATLLSVADAASKRDVRVFVAVYPRGSATTPLTPAARAEFSSHVAEVVRSLPSVDDVIVGNEPNLNRFWLPQFGRRRRTSPRRRTSLLAETYDAVKSAAPGCARLGRRHRPPRHRPPGHGPRHSLADDVHPRSRHGLPRQLARGTRDGRLRPPPVCRELARAARPAPSADDDDRPGRLRQARRVAGRSVRRNGATRQRAAHPLRRDRSRDRNPARTAGFVHGSRARSVTGEREQAAEYTRALDLVACQPTVEGVLLFHVRDEPRLEGWQSGVRYADGTPKASHGTVSDAAHDARNGDLDVRCAQ